MVDTGNTASNFRSPVIAEPSISASSSDTVLRTPYVGNVRALAPPPIPQLPMQQSQFGGMGGYGSYGNSGFNNYGQLGYGGAGGYGGLGGMGGLGSFGSYGGGYGGYGNSYGGYGGGYGGGYSRFGGGGMNPMDPESRFIQLAEASSRPAFQSIESLVSAIGNIASMLDSTFFALTSSFRAILGVAANFGRLRGVFAQFWSTFAIFRSLNYIYRKLLYWLRISNLDPASEAFKKAFAEAVSETTQQANGAPKPPRKGQSPWPVLAFLSFIFTAPYLIMKLLGTVTNTAQDEARNPTKWIQPIHTSALYNFEARNPSELTIIAGAEVRVAPKEIQQTLGLLNTGWALATIDGLNSGIIPINYVKSPQQLRQERQQLNEDDRLKLNLPLSTEPDMFLNNNPAYMTQQQPELMNLSSSAFPAPPMTVEQSLGMPPTTDVAAFEEGFA